MKKAGVNDSILLLLQRPATSRYAVLPQLRYGASLGGPLCNTSKMYVR
jgi:hypothetical protein